MFVIKYVIYTQYYNAIKYNLVSRINTGYWAYLHLTEQHIAGYKGWLSVNVDCGAVIIVPLAAGICLGAVIAAMFVVVNIWSAELHSVKGFKIVCTF